MIKYKLRKFRKLNRLNTRKIVLWISILLVFSLSLGSMAKYYAGVVNGTTDVKTGISLDGTTVTIDDSTADRDYYEGLNYTEAEIGKGLPTYSDKYNDNTLAQVQINYSSEDVNDSSKKGYVSYLDSERQSVYTYHKYYPIKTDASNQKYVEIELIDNPWSMRPNGYGFNGWVCDPSASTEGTNVSCDRMTFSYDNQYYTRYLRVNISDSNKLVINLKTSWIKAHITSTFEDITTFKPKALTPLDSSFGITDGSNMVGYFYKVSSPEANDLYYDSLGRKCSDSENSCSPEDKFKLIQPSDAYSTYDSSNISNYYYLVTRDTNIFEVPETNAKTLREIVEVTTSPFTITTSHDGSITTLSKVPQGNTKSKSDIAIESVELTGGYTIPLTASGADNRIGDYTQQGDDVKSFFAEYNLKIGRNVINNDNQYTLDSVVGGENTKVIVESGKYNNLVALPTVRRKFPFADVAIFGNDYDRATNNNSKLDVFYQVASVVGATHDNDSKLLSNIIVKSGFFGSGATLAKDTHEIYAFGVYAGSIRGSSGDITHSLRVLKIEGGKIININGGPGVDPKTTGLSIAIYIAGGEIENAVSGAGTAEAHGKRLISVTGGKVYNAVAAGSNSYYGETESGPLLDDTLVYIGGNAHIGGTETLLKNNTSNFKLYGVEVKGSVFGAGLGNKNTTDTGIVNNSTVIINGGTIEGEVYGGGNFGGAGLKKGGAKTDIIIKNGTVAKSVFGGSNQNGFGVPANPGNINIEMSGGTVENIYGGSNSNGLVSGNVTINLSGGNITSAVYGGGYGKDTLVNGEILINTDDSSEDNRNLVIGKDGKDGFIYGGSANGSVNKTLESAEEIDPNAVDPTKVQVYYKGPTVTNGDRVALASYGLKNGDYIFRNNTYYYVLFEKFSKLGNPKCISATDCQTYIAVDKENPVIDSDKLYYVPTEIIPKGASYGDVSKDFKETAIAVTIHDTGNVHVNINGGTIEGAVFGGGYGNENPPETKGSITVNVTKGNIGEVYGGNNVQGSIDKEKEDFVVNITGGTIRNVFGGSKGTNNTTDSTFVKVTNVNVTSGATITGGVYGGGRQVKTLTSYVNVTGGDFYNENAANETDKNASIFGGGYVAKVDSTNVEVSGITGGNVFGGSDYAGAVANAVVNIHSGTINGSVYAGGRKAPVENTVINLENSTINNAFAGGAEANVTSSTLNLKSGTVNNIFGGSDRDGKVTNSIVNIRNGIVGDIFGGNNEGGTAGNTLLDIEPVAETDNLVINNIYGGSKGTNAVSENTNVKIKGRITEDGVNHLTINTKNSEGEDDDTKGRIYGGGFEAVTTGNTNLYIEDVVVKEIYGGGVRGAVHGKTYVNLVNNVTANNVYGGGYFAFVGYSNSGPNGEWVSGNVPSTNSGGDTPRVGETHVNIINSKINNNVYGSGNASFVYGTTHVNIGDKAIIEIREQIESAKEGSYIKEFEPGFNEALNNLSIYIGGNVYGGSETNATEETVFNYKIVGVKGASKVSISADNYVKDGKTNITILGSIYGEGNNSIVSERTNIVGDTPVVIDEDGAYVLINKIGNKDESYKLVSIQRAKEIYIVDSNLLVSGMRDRSLGTATKYSLMNLKKMYLLGSKQTIVDNANPTGSTIYLMQSTTNLNAYFSGKADIKTDLYGISNFEAEKVTESQIDGTPNIEFANGVDNRIYMIESATAPYTFAVIDGETPVISADSDNGRPVVGMSFFGVFYLGNNDLIETSIYDSKYKSSSTYDGTLEVNHIEAFSQVFGDHEKTDMGDEAEYEYQRTNNGFFTNYLNKETNKISINYINPDPKNTSYYKWTIGNNILKIIVPMEANKYSQKTAVSASVSVESLLEELADGTTGYTSNATLKVTSVDTTSFQNGAEYKGYLVDKSTIPVINSEDVDPQDNVKDANNKFALEMGTTTAGWLDNYKTTFYSPDRAPEGVRNKCGDGGICVGDTTYTFDSSHDLRNLSFWLYYSENLDLSKAEKIDKKPTSSEETTSPTDPSTGDNDSENQDTEEENTRFVDMGYITIMGELQKYNDDFTMSAESQPVQIIVQVSLTDGETDSYGAFNAPGKKYEVFQDAEVSIASDGSFSLYQKLSLDLNQNQAAYKDPTPWDINELYNGQNIDKTITVGGIPKKQKWGPTERYLVSNYKFPQGTRITMIDLVTNKEYFMLMDYTKNEPVLLNEEYRYYLRDFAEMQYTIPYNDDNSKKEGMFYDENMITADKNLENGWTSPYYNANENYVTEEYVFIVDFGGVNDEETLAAKSVDNYYFYLKMARTVSTQNSDGSYTSATDDDVIAPRGNPKNSLTFQLNPTISSKVVTTAEFYDPVKKEYFTPTEDRILQTYDDDEMTVRIKSSLEQKLADATSSRGIVDTKYEDYRVGAKITIQRKAKDSVTDEYVDVTDELSGDSPLDGLKIKVKDEEFSPYTDGSIRIRLAGRITEIGSLIKFDFKKSDIHYGKYRLKIEAFVSYDGLYYGTEDLEPIYMEFELIDSDYGLKVEASDEESITHDVNTGKDSEKRNQIDYLITTSNGLINPNLKISLQRRLYTDNNGEDGNENAIYNPNYETIDINDLFSKIELIDKETDEVISNNVLDISSCLLVNQEIITPPTPPTTDGETGEETPPTPTEPTKVCSHIYNLGNIATSRRVENSEGEITQTEHQYILRVTLKDGPTEEEKANPAQSKWKSGTYRVIIGLYDDKKDDVGTTIQSNLIGESFEYLILRSLDVDGEEPSSSSSDTPSES